MNLKYKQIIDLFTDTKRTMKNGLWFSGVKGEGEFKLWHYNGKLFLHFFYKNNKQDGEYKMWDENGQLHKHAFYKNGEKIKDYLE